MGDEWFLGLELGLEFELLNEFALLLNEFEFGIVFLLLFSVSEYFLLLLFSVSDLVLVLSTECEFPPVVPPKTRIWLLFAFIMQCSDLADNMGFKVVQYTFRSFGLMHSKSFNGTPLLLVPPLM